MRQPCLKLRDTVEALEAGMGPSVSAIEEAKQHAEAGQAAFLEMRLKEAKEHYQRAAAAYATGFAALSYYGPLVDVLMHLGVAEAGTGGTGAVSAFLAALRLRPDADISDFSAVPEAEPAFAKAKALASSGDVGALSVESDPSNAEVYLDGRLVGVTPYTSDAVPVGPHFVALRKIGYERKSMMLEVQKGGTGLVTPSMGRLAPARRKPLYDTTLAKLARLTPDGMENMSAIEDVKALFLSDLALIVHVSAKGAKVSLWDLFTMQRVWSGTSADVGGSLGRGTAELLVSQAMDAYQQRTKVEERGAATVKGRGGIHTRWWFWTAIGAVVVGGTTAALVLTRPKAETHGFPHDKTGAIIIRF